MQHCHTKGQRRGAVRPAAAFPRKPPQLTAMCARTPVHHACAEMKATTHAARPAMYTSRALTVVLRTRCGHAALKRRTYTGGNSRKKTSGSRSTRAAALLMPRGHSFHSCCVHSSIRSGSSFRSSCARRASRREDSTQQHGHGARAAGRRAWSGGARRCWHPGCCNSPRCPGFRGAGRGCL